MLPYASSLQPAPQQGSRNAARSGPIRNCTTRWFPCPACYHAAGGLLPHLFTLTLHARRYLSVGLMSDWVCPVVPAINRQVFRRCPDFPRMGCPTRRCLAPERAYTPELSKDKAPQSGGLSIRRARMEQGERVARAVPRLPRDTPSSPLKMPLGSTAAATVR